MRQLRVALVLGVLSAGCNDSGSSSGVVDAGSAGSAGSGGASFEVLATGLSGQYHEPYGIALDASHVYFTIEGQTAPALARVAKSGGATETLADNEYPLSSRDVLVDGSGVYWNRHSVQPSWPGGIGRVAHAGGVREDVILDAEYVEAMVASDSHVYWSEPNGIFARDKSLTTDAAQIATTSRSACRLAIDSSHLYWIIGESSGGSIWRQALAPDAAAEQLATDTDDLCGGLAVQGGAVFWTFDAGSFTGGVRAWRPETQSVELVFDGLWAPRALVIAGEQAWVGEFGGGRLWRFSLVDGSGSEIATDALVTNSGLALDATRLYAATNAGEIIALPR